MAASLWSKSLALLPAARTCRCSHRALAPHSLGAGRFTSLRHAHAMPAAWKEKARERAEKEDTQPSRPSEAEGEQASLPHSDQPTFDTLQGIASPPVLQALTKFPFKLTHMSPVQAAVFPLLPKLLEPHDSADATGPRDLLVKARTGTGKTLAFLVPAVESRLKQLRAREEWAKEELSTTNKRQVDRVVEQFARENVGALIISPTRELATQIANEAIKLTRHLDRFQVRLLVGGLPKRAQLREWNTGRRDIVVATPGRLRDCIENESKFADEIRTSEMFILDEADTLLDMGFREDIQAITDVLKPSPERQTFMFSATVSKAIQQIARKTLAENHQFINCVPDDALPTHMSIPQYYTGLPSPNEQIPHILRLIAEDQLTNPGTSKVLIFLPTTSLTQLYANILRDVGDRVLPSGNRTRWGVLHSKMTMGARMRQSDTYRKDKSGASVMVTSDVSARGVDYPGVTRVIQIGVPSSSDVYVHRVGRTGRGSNMSGRADLVLMPWELGFLTWQLKDIPLKELPTNQLAQQVLELAKQHDADEDKRGVLPGLERMDEYIAQMQTRVSPEDVRESMVSLCAYYAAQHAELRVQMGVVSQGVHDWAAALTGQEVQLNLPREFTFNKRSRDGGNKYKRDGRPERRSRDRFDDRSFGSRRDGERSFGRDRDDGERSFGRPRRNDDGERRPYSRDRDDGERRSYRSDSFDGERRERSFRPRENRGSGAHW